MDEEYMDDEMKQCTKECLCKQCENWLSCQISNGWDCKKCNEQNWKPQTICKFKDR